MLSRRHEEAGDDMCLNGFEYHSLGKCCHFVMALSEVTVQLKLFPVLGPASLSVLQLNRSELVHMRHVMVKIELDSRLHGGQREVDTMLARLEAGRVCVVCTKYVFIFLGIDI